MKLAVSMRRLAAAALTLALCGGASSRAQTNAGRQLQFQVVDADSGAPVEGVRVRSWARGDKQTDAQGECLIPLPESKEGRFSYRITLAKPGYVPRYIMWSSAQNDTIESIPTNYVAHLGRGAGIGGVIKNEKGEPIAGAKVIFSGPPPSGVERERTMVAPGYHSERTDEEGRWTNSDAPPDLGAMVFRVTALDYLPVAFACTPKDENTNLVIVAASDLKAGKAVTTLGHGIVFDGQVMDAKGEPVVGAVVTKDFEWRNPATTQETDASGKFEIINLQAGDMMLTVQSKDWAPRTLAVKLAKGMPATTIALKAGVALKGRVVDETGKPIAGARVQLDRMGNSPLEFDWSTESESEGIFEWSAAPEGEHPYLVAAAGFHPRSEPAWVAGGADKEVALRHDKGDSGAEVDGVVTDEATGKPLTNYVIKLTEYRGTAAISGEQPVTAADGRDPIDIDTNDQAYVVSVRAAGYLPQDGDKQLTGDGDQSRDFELEAGTARGVKGRLVVNNYNDWIDWTHGQDVSLTTTVAKPAGLDSDDPEAAERLMEDFLATREGKKWRQAQRPQVPQLDAHGDFVIGDVAPGKHELRALLTKAAQQGGGQIGMLVKEIDVPEGAGTTNALDLGTVEVPARKDLNAGDMAPDFTVKTTDGGQLHLGDFRGKYVLLDFWATWCGPCVAEMPNLKRAYDTFWKDPQLVMISLSLDADVAAPKAFARKNGIHWLQGFLGNWNDTDVPNRYGVDGIPAIFLIGPDGKVVEHDLRGQAISDALKRALNTSN